MTTPSITITKIDHDSWWGYYIGEELYGYNDYYNFTDYEVELQARMNALEQGIINKPKDPLDIKLVYHTSWDFDDDLFEEAWEEFSGHLPDTLTEFKQWFIDRSNP